MGSGKTSAAINYMNSHKEERFIFVSEELEEDQRIANACPDLHFALPDDETNSSTKTMDLIKLLSRGRNVAITHVLLTLCDETVCEAMAQYNYTLIIDEAVNIFQKCKTTRDDIESMKTNGELEITEKGLVRLTETGKTKEHNEIVRQDLRLASSHQLVSIGTEGLYYWIISDRMLRACKKVIIMTYLFEKTDMAKFLKLHKFTYSNLHVKRTENNKYFFCNHLVYIPEYVGNLSELIHICSNPKLNKIGDNQYALSATWHKEQANIYRRLLCKSKKENTAESKEKLKKCSMHQLQSYLESFMRYENKAVSSDKKIWTSYKSSSDVFKQKGYKNCFLHFNATATNKFSNRYVMAYLCNVFQLPDVHTFYAQNGIADNAEDSALITIIQWIWRGAIRNGKPIELYLPSKRMRKILEKWIVDTETWYHKFMSGNTTADSCEEAYNEGGEIKTQTNPAA